MKYDISKQKAPEMPKLGKGTECIKLLLSQASKDMYEPLIPMYQRCKISVSEHNWKVFVVISVSRPDFSRNESHSFMA